MKLNIIYSICIGLIIVLSGCEDLNQEVKTTLSDEQIFISYDRTLTHSVGTYAALPDGFLSINGAMRASASDEAEHTLETSNVQKFNVGSWNQISNPDNVWNDLFKGIRRANQYLIRADSIDWSNYILYQTPERQLIYEERLKKVNRTKYEIRYLRAYFYFELVKRYGGVPLITEELPYNADIQDINRSSLDDCVQFIVSECDSAIAVLSETYPNEELGRATKGAAMALKSRMLLYAASDLYNNSDNELVSLIATDRDTLWQDAADAAKELIDLGIYSLDPEYAGLFKTFDSPEIIFTRRNGASNSFEKTNYPIGYDLGKSGTTPTQNLVDAYEMVDGTTISEPGTSYDPQNPYENRDPRLEMTIVTNNSMFKDRPVEIWEGGRDGPGVPLASRTGYYLRKYVDEGLDLLLGNSSVHSWHIFRLAEIYLNYAEALNEVDPGNPDINTYVDDVRDRVGMPPLPGGLNQDQMREKIRNERRVELAFEDHRFWDVRRWMIAEETLGTPIQGMDITRVTDSTFTYTKKIVENRVFEPKMYFYPISQAELGIATHWEQNPLW